MSDFIKIKASEQDIAKRSHIHEVGTNDAWYKTKRRIDGKQVMCPVYLKWCNMFERCYCPKWHEKYPTYESCTVCEEWLSFSNFSAWLETQDWEGMHLDKDFKHKGNKIYSPENCLLIPGSLNNLLNDRAPLRGECPIGVDFYKRTGKFRARISLSGKSKHLGYLKTSEAAHQVYVIAHNDNIDRQAGLYPEFAQYLDQHKLQTG